MLYFLPSEGAGGAEVVLMGASVPRIPRAAGEQGDRTREVKSRQAAMDACLVSRKTRQGAS